MLKFSPSPIHRSTVTSGSLTDTNLFHPGSKLVINEQVDEEVAEVVDGESEPVVAVDWSTDVKSVEGRCHREKENDENTDPNFCRFYVTRVLFPVFTENGNVSCTLITSSISNI